MILKDAIDEWIYDLELKSVSKETIRAYKNNLKLFNDFINDKKQVEYINVSDIKSYIKTNKDRGLKTKTINSHISSLRNFFNYCIEECMYNKSNPCYSIKLLKATDTKTIEVFTREEMKLITEYNKLSKDYIPFRNHIIGCFLLETGIRNHELVNLKHSDFINDYILLKITKNSKPRVVPVSKLLQKKLNKYVRIKNSYFEKLKKLDKIDDNYFLSRTGRKLHQANISQIVDKICKECDIPMYKAYPHNFRHTFAVNMLKNTNDIYTVSKLLGHQQVGITEIYLQGIKNDDILSMVNGKGILENL